MHPYANKIKELSSAGLKDICDRADSLDTFTEEEQKRVIWCVLTILAEMYGTFRHFFTSAEEKNFCISGWNRALVDTAPNKIFSALYQFCCGKVKNYTDFPPSPIAFRKLCDSYATSIPQSIIDKYALPKPESNKASQEVFENHRKEIARFLKPKKSNAKPLLLENTSGGRFKDVSIISQQLMADLLDKAKVCYSAIR